jgi:hypothetical protein
MAKTNYKMAWGTHLPVLIHLIGITDGPVLELGMGLYSSPFLHWACHTSKRPLDSYDNEQEWFGLNGQYRSENHSVTLVDDWDKIDVKKDWDVAFIDLNPVLRRKDMAARLADCAKFVVLHDSQGGDKNIYLYQEIYPLFKYKYNYDGAKPNTVILSNFVDLSNFKIR